MAVLLPLGISVYLVDVNPASAFDLAANELLLLCMKGGFAKDARISNAFNMELITL